jgi:hypothetical protein
MKIWMSVLAALLSAGCAGCEEECDPETYADNCHGDVHQYCGQYEGPLTQEQSGDYVVKENICDRGDSSTSFCVEHSDASIQSRARCVVSKELNPKCDKDVLSSSYCEGGRRHSCYYGYLSHVSGAGHGCEQ